MKITFNKPLKILSIIVIIFGLMWGAWRAYYYYYIPWLYFGERQMYTWGCFRSLIRTLLKIPYGDTQYQIVKDTPEDLEEISYEEWMSMECSYPDNAGDLYSSWAPMASGAELDVLGKKGQKHIMCISPGIFADYGYVNKMPIRCRNIFDCDNIYVAIHEYVLKYPKVLNNLIKIVEKPCFYLKELPVAHDPTIKPFDDRNFRIKQTRRELYCDKTKIMPYEQDRTYSEIAIVDSQGRVKMQILVPRKDNAHLIKK